MEVATHGAWGFHPQANSVDNQPENSSRFKQAAKDANLLRDQQVNNAENASENNDPAAENDANDKADYIAKQLYQSGQSGRAVYLSNETLDGGETPHETNQWFRDLVANEQLAKLTSSIIR